MVPGHQRRGGKRRTRCSSEREADAGLLAIALVLAALAGALTELEAGGRQADLITDVVFWRGVGASAIGSFVTRAVTIALLSSTLGLPALFAKWGAGQP